MKLEVRAMTNRHGSREIAVVISSTMPSAKILLLWVAAYVLERQHRERRFVRERQRRSGHHPLGHLNAVDADGPSHDVLDLLLAQILASPRAR